MQLIVAGVDGSEASVDALRFAASEARAHGAKLRAVLAWQPPAGMYSEWMAIPLDELERNLEREATETLAAAIEALGDDAEGVEIEPVVRLGPAVAALVGEAESADLLVVGSRGRGGFTGLLLGSVSQTSAQHAPCPITIVKAAADS